MYAKISETSDTEAINQDDSEDEMSIDEEEDLQSTSNAESDIVCENCKSGEDPETLLLCDTCNRGWHTQCIKLDSVPDGEWYCAECSAMNKNHQCPVDERMDLADQPANSNEETMNLDDSLDGEIRSKRNPKRPKYYFDSDSDSDYETIGRKKCC